MQKPYFNLIDEPWIPCIPLQGDGTPQLFSLRETLTRAHELCEIYSDSPLTIAALHRLLLAILHDVFGPKDTEAWKELWQGVAWNEEQLNAYFESVHDHFYLFHETYPFYQVAEFPPNSAKELLPVATLSAEVSSGNNVALFDHHFDTNAEKISLDDAARRLITYQNFAIGFGISHSFNGQTVRFTDSPTVRGAMILIKGENLFQSLLLNMRMYPSPYSNRLPDNTEIDKPAWKKEPVEIFSNSSQVPDGYLDFLTWQSRQIRFVMSKMGGKIVITHVQRIQGRTMDKEKIFDPLKSYRFGKDGKPSVRGFSLERALWRDSVALLNVKATDARTLPEPVTHLAQLVDADFITSESRLNFLALGFATSEGKAASVALWRSEHIPLPLDYLKNEASVGELGKALRLAESAGAALKRTADWLCWLWVKQKDPKWASPEKDNVETYEEWQKNLKQYRQEDHDFKGYESFRNQFPIERDFWWRLDEPFRRCLPGFASEDETLFMQAHQEWKDQIRSAAHTAWNMTADMLEVSPRSLRVRAGAEEIFRIRLEAALNPKPKEGENDDENSAD
jgi:CRISPR system Cascade subunit CasA